MTVCVSRSLRGRVLVSECVCVPVVRVQARLPGAVLAVRLLHQRVGVLQLLLPRPLVLQLHLEGGRRNKREGEGGRRNKREAEGEGESKKGREGMNKMLARR